MERITCFNWQPCLLECPIRSRSLSYSLCLFSITASWRFCCCFSAGSFSVSVQKRTRTCVGRCCRRSQRLRFRSLCAFCDCKKQQQQQQQKARKLNKQFSSRVCGCLLSSASKTVSIKSAQSRNNILFSFRCCCCFSLTVLFLIEHSCWQHIHK